MLLSEKRPRREGEGKEGKTTALDIFQEGANIPERGGGVLVPAFKKNRGARQPLSIC